MLIEIMKKSSYGIILIILTTSLAIAADTSSDTFGALKKYFFSISIGKNLREIEKELKLPPPDKTYMGSSSYKDRLFRYYNVKGMMLQIGLVQKSADSSYEQGDFSFNGDFLIVGKEREYDYCCSVNGWTEIYDGPLRQ